MDMILKRLLSNESNLFVLLARRDNLFYTSTSFRTASDGRFGYTSQEGLQ